MGRVTLVWNNLCCSSLLGPKTLTQSAEIWQIQPCTWQATTMNMFHRRTRPECSVLRLRSSGCWAVHHHNDTTTRIEANCTTYWNWSSHATARHHVLPIDHWRCMDRRLWSLVNGDHTLQQLQLTTDNTKHTEWLQCRLCTSLNVKQTAIRNYAYIWPL